MSLNKVIGLFICMAVCLNTSQVIAGKPNIITRAQWGAKPDTGNLTQLEVPVERIIIAHTAGKECSSKDTCSQEARNIQHTHMITFSFDDIAYNYLIGNDGNVYEGRGSKYQGAGAKGFNVGSISLGFMGVFIKDLPSQAALDAAKSLIEQLKTEQKLKQDYKLFGHRQLAPTVSPGDVLYAEIQTWPNWAKE